MYLWKTVTVRVVFSVENTTRTNHQRSIFFNCCVVLTSYVSSDVCWPNYLYVCILQIEEQAIQELMTFYNAQSVDDEHITVQRVTYEMIAPQWITK